MQEEEKRKEKKRTSEEKSEEKSTVNGSEPTGSHGEKPCPLMEKEFAPGHSAIENLGISAFFRKKGKQ